ncbi:MAG: 2-oxoglutarate oxidoreductase [Eubacteriaceae bacterium]|jgi:2-oxoglutarate ferredoxin oxidoreductase subunit beta|nr:2-oxoglutarate oxidoreductase [Eubacteriaceae bacterium]
MEAVYKRCSALTEVNTSFCPGCSHGLAFKIIAEIAEELEIQRKLVWATPIGCTTFSFGYHSFSTFGSPHGRAAATATGFKRRSPKTPLILYQGDGDAAAIGLGETLHAAARGENFTVIMANNQVYGMTGGQMAPTTLIGQKTTTTPKGRSMEKAGNPFRLAEQIAVLDAPKYVTRQALHSPKHVLAAKAAIKKALQIQMGEGGYSYIELLTACPTNWKIDPRNIKEYMEKYVIPQFPLGDLKG